MAGRCDPSGNLRREAHTRGVEIVAALVLALAWPAGGAAASPTPSGGAPADVAPCAPPDGFEAPSYWTTFEGEGASPSLDAGAGHIDVGDGDGKPGYGGFVTAKSYDLKSCGVWVRVRAVLATSDPEAVTFFRAPQADETHVVRMFVRAGTLHAESRDGSTSSSKSAPYDESAHAYWRVRADDADKIHFDTSRDGKVWTTFHSTPRAPFLDKGAFHFGVGAGAEAKGAGMPWRATFASFDGG